MELNPSRRVSVSELAGNDRRSVEHLLGQSLQEDQQVYILAFTPGIVPDENTRLRALASMRQTFAQTDQHAQPHGPTDSAIDEAVDQALDAIRYGKS